jgi:hypothetical protein
MGAFAEKHNGLRSINVRARLRQVAADSFGMHRHGVLRRECMPTGLFFFKPYFLSKRAHAAVLLIWLNGASHGREPICERSEGREVSEACVRRDHRHGPNATARFIG